VRLQEDGSFAQYGNSPNFQGGVITLCACKHRMRTAAHLRNDADVWVAGITSSGLPSVHGRRYLFYLMLIHQRADSQAEMWERLPREARQAKSASKHRLGDVYEPRRAGLSGDGRFMVDNYRQPCKEHVHRDGNHWHLDVNYPGNRRPVLLTGDPERSYLWTRPSIWLEERHPLPRNPRASATPQHFVDRLRS
jgi:hypothetical protein